MGYHKKVIKKGTLGCFSKIREEFEEMEDAWEQANPVLVLCELCDLYGAMEAFLNERYPKLNMRDIEHMAHATRSAFADGSRA